MKLAARRAGACALVILAAAALLRAWIVRSTYSLYLPQAQPDEGYYEMGVLWLADHDFRAWRGPLYPAFVAACEEPFATPEPGRVRAALGLASVGAVGAALALGGGSAPVVAGLLPAAALALSPEQLESLISLNIHAFYGLLLVLLAVGAALWARRPTRWGTALLGAACGASLLCRSAHLPLPFLLAAYAAWRGRWTRAAFRRGALLLLCAAGAASPWALRNLAREGRWYPLDLDAGAVNLYAASLGRDLGTNIPVAFAQAKEEQPSIRGVEAPAPDFASLRSLAARHILARPARYLAGALRRSRLLFGAFVWSLALGAFGLWRRRHDPASHMILLTALSLLTYASVGFDPAYLDGIAPLTALMAGWGLAALPGAEATGARAPWKPGLLLGLAAAPFILAYAAMLVLFVRDFRPPSGDPRYLMVLVRKAEVALAPGGPTELRARVEDEQHRQNDARQALARVEAFRALSEARRALSEGRTPEAEALAEAALAQGGLLQLRRATLLKIAAAAELQEGRRDEANRSLLEAVRVDAGTACLEPVEGVETSSLDPSFFSACIAARPKTASLWVDRGVSRFYRGQKAQAAEDFRQALRLDPGSLEAALSLAALSEGPARAEARRLLQRAVDLSGRRAPRGLRAQATRELSILAP